jgi:tetratricopeptide (TPR) repeat protein
MRLGTMHFIILLIFVISFSVLSAEDIMDSETRYEEALREKEYAFQLVSEFFDVLSKKGYAPALNFNSIRWKYRTEMRRNPNNPFLPFCMGELYRYKDRYEEAFEYYEEAIRRADTDIYKHIILLNLFSHSRLHQWQVAEEENFIELQRDMGALSLPLLSTYFFVRGREAIEKGLANDIEKSIRISQELNPYNLGVRMFYIRYLFLNRRFDFFDEFLSLFRIILQDFKTKLLVSVFTYNFLFTFFALLLCSFTVAFFVKYFSSIAVKITNVIPRKLPMRIRYVLSIVILLLPIIWTIPSFFTFIFLLVIPIAFLEKKERWIVQTFIFLLLVVSFFGWFQMKSLTAMNPRERIDILDEMQKSEYEERLIEKCDSLLALNERDFAMYYLKGLLLKRGGFFEEAEENYKKAISLVPNYFHSYNNLGNVFFWKGEVDSSLKYYDLAMIFETRSPALHYNLAQSYIRKLQFDRSSRHMKIASQLDFDLISRQTKNAEEENNRFLIDLTLPPEVLWMEFSSLDEDQNVFPWKYVGFDYRVFSIFLFVFFLLNVIVPRVIKKVKGECPICKSPISKGNSKLFESETICWRCHEQLSSISSVDIQERLKDKISIESQSRRGYTAILLGLFFPGLGHLHIGRLRTGLLYILLFIVLCTILLLNRITEISLPFPFFSEPNIGLYVIVAIIVFLYLFSLLSLFGSAFEERK